MFTEIYLSLRQGFQESRFKFLFQNTVLAKLLTQDEIPSAWVFFRTYLSSWRWNAAWFRSLIQNQSLEDLDHLVQFDAIVRSLQVLEMSGIFTEENCNRVAARSFSCLLTSAFSSLQKAGILNQANFSLIIVHPVPVDLALGLSYLHQAGILNEENRAVVKAYANPIYLASVLSRLQRSEILTQANFTALLAPNHANLVSEETRLLIWSRIPSQFINQANFQRLLTAAEHVNPMEELQRVRDQIIGVHVAAFNPSQSTHTASVHRSVSDSALKLRQSYGAGFNLEIKIQEIKNFVNGLSDSPKHQAAKRCIKRITQVEFTFIDSSDISTRQLLVFAYTAIHDDSKRSGTLENALDLFVEGLYEIQRGYNINDLGQDSGSPDSPICASGTFNKLIEKLNGIHQDVAVYYITHECASAKFPRLAIAHANTYLQSAVLAATANDYRRVKELLEGLKTDGSLEPVWENIKAGVQTELWGEFKEAYGNNPRHEKFLSLINNGQYLPLPDVSAFEAALITSPGHQACLDEQIRLSLNEQGLVRRLAQHSIWVNRDSSADARENFDKQYGLVLMS